MTKPGRDTSVNTYRAAAIAALGRRAGSPHWVAALGRRTGSPHWVAALGRRTESPHWVAALSRRTGSPHWVAAQPRPVAARALGRARGIARLRPGEHLEQI